MTAALVLRGVYDATGEALVTVGQPAVAVLLLTMPNPNGSGPDVPQDLTGRSFVQRVFDQTGAIVASAAGQILGAGQVRFTLDAPTIAALLPAGAGAIDLYHALVEVTAGGDDPILSRPFGIRAPAAGLGSAVFVLDTDAVNPAPLVVRYAGAQGAQGPPGPGQGVCWSASGAPFAAGELLGTRNVPDAFTIDTGPRSFGWSSLGGPAAACAFQVMDTAGIVYVTANLAVAYQAPTLVFTTTAVAAGARLQLWAPDPADLNLSAFSLTLAPLV